ncbi:MAG: hypothetical protein IKA36_07105 [Clostridia bacterium]|nr:hypothetical protein [Clostridia bacterium]
MKDLVYPAIAYKDDEKGTNTGWWAIKIVDLGIVADGETLVDAFLRAKAKLCAIVECAIKFDCEIESPSDFEEISKANPKDTVLLVDAFA